MASKKNRGNDRPDRDPDLLLLALRDTQARADHAEELVKQLEHRIGELGRMITALQMREQEVATKWRGKVSSLEAEAGALREKRQLSCSCPVGECRKDAGHVLRGTCWAQWCYSRRSQQ